MTFVLLGILNAQAAGVAPIPETDFDLLETTTLGTASASVTFDNLDTYTDYKHLQVRMVARSAGSGSSAGIRLRLNGDTGTNYAFHRLFGDGSSVSSSASTSQNHINAGVVTESGSASNSFSASVIDILDFSSTSKNTTIRSLSGQTDQALIFLNSGLFIDTSAITSLELATLDGSYVIGSRFSLYGIKAGA